MTKQFLISLLLIILCAAAGAAPPGERYIIQFTDGGAAEGRSAVAELGTIVRDLDSHNAVAAHVPTAALDGLKHNPNVAFVELDAKRYPLAQTIPYGIPLVQADQVSDAGAGSQKVCIIDSGYALGHEDLGINLVSGTPEHGWYVDGCGHGTHVSGTIAALNNGVGVVGVLPSDTINLYIVRVLGDDCDWAYASDLVAAFYACRDNGATVVNMSLGGGHRSRTEQRAFEDAWRLGFLLVAPAGNEGNTRMSYPASYDTVISVAAVDENIVALDFSQQNAQVELAAPGVAVLSTVPMGTGREGNVNVGADTVQGMAIEGSPTDSATGALVDCGLGTSVCTGAGGAVCLIERGEVTFADKVINCELGGGVAAAIYNNVTGTLVGTLSGVETSIPSVGVTRSDGANLLGRLGETAAVSVTVSNYAIIEGTSQAAAHVSGVAALVWSHHPNCSNENVRNALAASAMDLGPPGRDDATGYGLIQALSAVNLLNVTGCSGGSCLPKGDACNIDAECCSNKCKGKPGAMTCK